MGIKNKSRRVLLRVLQGGKGMSLREELYYIAIQAREKKGQIEKGEFTQLNKHKFYANIFLKEQCRKAAKKGNTEAPISRLTELKDGLYLSQNDLQRFAKANNLDFNPCTWTLGFNKK